MLQADGELALQNEFKFANLEFFQKLFPSNLPYNVIRQQSFGTLLVICTEDPYVQYLIGVKIPWQGRDRILDLVTRKIYTANEFIALTVAIPEPLLLRVFIPQGYNLDTYEPFDIKPQKIKIGQFTYEKIVPDPKLPDQESALGTIMAVDYAMVSQKRQDYVAPSGAELFVVIDAENVFSLSIMSVVTHKFAENFHGPDTTYGIYYYKIVLRAESSSSSEMPSLPSLSNGSDADDGEGPATQDFGTSPEVAPLSNYVIVDRLMGICSICASLFDFGQVASCDTCKAYICSAQCFEQDQHSTTCSQKVDPLARQTIGVGRRASFHGSSRHGLTAGKAREILHDKSVHGHPLTDRQRRFFGWIAGGGK